MGRVCLATSLALILTAVPFTGFAADSSSMNGVLGLNTVPSARMDPAGTFRVGVARDQHYTQAYSGVQIADHLYLGVRQSIGKDQTQDAHLYPGMDIKLRLYNEQRFRPEISVGLQSAFGHKRMAAEHLALSKRYHDFDFTMGIGWGRLGTRGGFTNPLLLKQLDKKDRDLDGESPSTPEDWFTGQAALFGGVQYSPDFLNGLSFKADWSSDGWKAERAADAGFDLPSPWSVGVSYRPASWFDIGIAYQHNNSVMARLNLSPNLEDWGARDAGYSPTITLEPHRFRTDTAKPYVARLTNQRLGLSHVERDGYSISANLDVKATTPVAFQIGESARQLSNQAGAQPEQISLNLSRYGLRGPNLTLSRPDIERLHLTHQGSAEEVWQNTQIELYVPTPVRDAHDLFKKYLAFKVDWISDVSLAEDDAGILYRTALVPSLFRRISPHVISETAVRINLAHNLDHLVEYRGVSLFPVRGDVDRFTQNRFLLERQYLAAFGTILPDVHVAASIGYLEEMYAGITGEILYRPFDKNWAVGAELHEVFKRDPDIALGLGPNGDHILSGYLNGYYEIPDTGATLHASAGRFLAGDVGASLGLTHVFDNGVKAEGLVRISNKSDPDIYGGRTNSYAGLSLSLPLGSLPFIPDGSRSIIHTKPLGRDTAQRLDNPVSLYDVTEPLSYRAVTRQWSALSGRF